MAGVGGWESAYARPNFSGVQADCDDQMMYNVQGQRGDDDLIANGPLDRRVMPLGTGEKTWTKK